MYPKGKGNLPNFVTFLANFESVQSHQHRINIASTSLCGVQKRPGANFSSVQRQFAVKGNEVESGGGIYRSARIHLAIFVTRRKVRGVSGASKNF